MCDGGALLDWAIEQRLPWSVCRGAMWMSVAEVLEEGAESRETTRQERGWHVQGIAGKPMWRE